MICEETIVAVSTPPGVGAIGIIRLSGTKALTILEGVWEGDPTPYSFEPRRIYVGGIRRENHSVDRVIAFWMKAPHSYTGEDLVEVHGHGGRRLMELLLETFVKAGARPAQPGEFTRRAFLNGRIDLVQAEAVADLISACGSAAVREAGRQLEGCLSRHVGQIRNNLKVLRAQMEAMIDFPEDEDVQVLHDDETIERIDGLLGDVARLASTYEEGRWLRDGVKIAIVGKPNAGKSSLFNALVGDDRAIVHHTPGTTRDLIEERLDWNGLAVRFIDTAGLHASADLVESEGIRRTRGRLAQADLVLAVFDGSLPFSSEDAMVLEAIGERPVLFIVNKKDLPQRFDRAALPADTPPLLLSALTGDGVSNLKGAIIDRFLRREGGNDETPLLTNLRHKVALDKGGTALGRVREGCAGRRSLELIAADLKQATDALGEITGEVTTDEILSEIFSRFCIGK